MSVSIPQSGFGAFERRWRNLGEQKGPPVSIPQSGFGAFELARSGRMRVWWARVSIPQSGFGAFEPRMFNAYNCAPWPFQSLSRDSGRLNHDGHRRAILRQRVSIPQSGFGAFEPFRFSPLLHPVAPVSIPQSGFGAFERAHPGRPGLPGRVSIPQSGFGAFEPRAAPGAGRCDPVSIPQSGFGAFERAQPNGYYIPLSPTRQSVLPPFPLLPLALSSSHVSFVPPSPPKRVPPPLFLSFLPPFRPFPISADRVSIYPHICPQTPASTSPSPALRFAARTPNGHLK